MRLKFKTSRVISLLLIVFINKSACEQCTIDVKKDLHETHPPLIVQPHSDNPEYLYPTAANDSKIVINSGESINIFCPGKIRTYKNTKVDPSWIEIRGHKFQPSKISVPIECIGKNKFDADGITVEFSDISCEQLSSASYNSVLRATGLRCGIGYQYEIGFIMKDDSFLKTIDLCHDLEAANTLWSHSIISSVNDHAVRYTGLKTEDFKTGGLYENMNMSMENPYKLSNFYQNFISTFNSTDTANKYASPNASERNYLARGHLIANADKIYKSEQMSTYFYANVVPMWQKINARPGNWFFVEEYVRYMAVSKKQDLEVWVGGLGVLQLEDKPIYLYNKLNKQTGKIDHKIPVPRNLFKCVIDRSSKESICFVVVNNPYATRKKIFNPANKYIVCKNYRKCDLITENFKDEFRGFAYCCALKDFYEENQDSVALDDIKPFLDYKPIKLPNIDKSNLSRLLQEEDFTI